jgi:hypothetical protein
METADRQLPSDREQQSRKKAYRKPSLQVYGTLAQMTRAIPGSTPATLDGSGPVPAPHNRT